MTISATPSDTTVPVIEYGISLKGIKLTSITEEELLMQKIYIVRSLGME